MADSWVLYSPAASPFQLASYVRVDDPEIDFGEADLFKANFSENPAAEGAALAFDSVGKRQFTFPLRVASGPSAMSLQQQESLLRLYARPGAYIDLQPDGVASAESVRFDVLAGRYEPAFNSRMNQQLDRRDGTLKFDVQPYGYWPTMIMLASAASIGGPGVLTFSGGSIFGDAPGLAEIFVAPTNATDWGFTGLVRGKSRPDIALWSLGARPSFQGQWLAASAIASGQNSGVVPTLLGEVAAPGSQTIRYFVSTSGLQTWINSSDDFYPFARWIIPPTLEPAYRGRFRTYALMRLHPLAVPSAPLAWYVSADAQSGTFIDNSLASAAPIATLAPALASFNSPNQVGMGGVSTNYQFLDLGEVTLPPVASVSEETQIRLWVSSPTNNVRVPTSIFDIGGLYLQPLDGAAGILSRGLCLASHSRASYTGRLYLSAVDGNQTIESPTSGVASRLPLRMAAGHIGVLPRVGASTIQLDLNIAGHQIVGLNDQIPSFSPPVRGEPYFAQVSVRYRPRFTFLKGL